MRNYDVIFVCVSVSPTMTLFQNQDKFDVILLWVHSKRSINDKLPHDEEIFFENNDEYGREEMLFCKIYNKLVQIVRRDVFLKCKRALQPEWDT